MGGLIITLNKHDITRLKNEIGDEITVKVIRVGKSTVDVRIIAPSIYKITRDSYKKGSNKIKEKINERTKRRFEDKEQRPKV